MLAKYTTTPHRMLTLVGLAGWLAGCAMQVSPGDTQAELDACAEEEEAFVAACSEDPAECELAAESVRAVCAVDDKTDVARSRLNRIWLDGGRECYEEKNLLCLTRHFRKLVLAWRYVYRYPQAARAMENFLDCEEGELNIPREAFEEDLGQDSHFPEALSVGQLLETTREAAMTQAAATTADTATFDLGSPLVVPSSPNVRFAIGRTHVHTTADFVRGEETSEVRIQYTFRDPYDFHPTRSDDHSPDSNYAETFPYHAWATLLVDTFYACEFDHVGAWEETLEVP